MGLAVSSPPPAVANEWTDIESIARRGKTGDVVILVTHMKATIGHMKFGQLATKMGGGVEALKMYWQPCHVGMLLRDPPRELLKGVDEKGGEIKSDSGVYIIDTAPHENIHGTVIAPLEESLKSWTKMYGPTEAGLIYRPLRKKEKKDGSREKESGEDASNENLDLSGIESDAVWEFLKKSTSIKFNLEREEIFELVLERWLYLKNRTPKPDLKTLYCAELVAHAFQIVGMLKTVPAANTYLPLDFLPDARLEKNLEGETEFIFGSPLGVAGIMNGKNIQPFNVAQFWNILAPVSILVISFILCSGSM
mmetsp:Transcript_19519/g.47670  ORF Transcript_19519/g.47670 Transcript_19519/m.47670 type:complete len:308 (+) Transcript_19519:234-1157(+)|eukprot:CAMPEP_0114489232 /NCGR_PEP_ID=MMETSP0109-20121206/1776_1 /TAXON_ID=29199 /ORGANISM="Chlorarachnion reptans, Strain CCCM449" /LENGTH=307 /DNA_ID=CAMNT_0001665723 /DNA_START=162 /DNA_END=1085 /DNA_ORIENTATION=+